MNEQPHRRRRSRHADDPERALITAVRRALLPALGLPLAVAGVGASWSGQGLSVLLSAPVAAIVLAVNLVCWLRVIARWRALPRPDDDDLGWWRWWGGDTPLDPTGGGGIHFDWDRFERQFWAHVEALQRQRERQLVPA